MGVIRTIHVFKQDEICPTFRLYYILRKDQNKRISLLYYYPYDFYLEEHYQVKNKFIFNMGMVKWQFWLCHQWRNFTNVYHLPARLNLIQAENTVELSITPCLSEL